MAIEKQQDSESTTDSRVSSGAIGEALARRVIIERIRPAIDGGRFAIKRTPGEAVEVRANIFADGHDLIAAVLRDRHCDAREPWRETPMSEISPGSDEWAAGF